MPENSTDELTRAIANLKAFCKRGECVGVLRLAGLSDWKIKDSMKLLPKHFPLGCKYARYRRHEFLKAFELSDPDGRISQQPTTASQPGASKES